MKKAKEPLKDYIMAVDELRKALKDKKLFGNSNAKTKAYLERILEICDENSRDQSQA